ncbi:MAG: mismatch-specific DNA-glycosylase [Chloroflexota bacterium]
MILPDVLQANLHLVFCGTAASTKSAEVGAYYANSTNYFWRTLHEVGLTPHQLTPTDFRQLLTYRIGLTDIAKHAIGNDSVLSQSDFDADALCQKIERYQPQILAFTSKRGASAFLKQPTGKISYGQQSETVSDTKLWVLPSPSGSARRYWDISIWQNLADTVGNLPKSINQ